ncbi:MAG: 16S rRNA (adenine(1518)-N(6)/adenine(1519)-N(6))-dimethyltransferase RsmA [Oscillospiraceae bacterium]|nr:16S rRNA (adenine(1518)-N(6)/adenine(1519)-N(6))-dimethyltransferase RsmA [Oscillospiraceae bacterium]
MKYDLTDIREIRALLEGAGFRFSKALGQNFLCDATVPKRIAEAAGLDDGTGVLEIGPGVGCLTVELAERARRVVSVELDEGLRPVLARTLADCGNVALIYGDILRQDLPALVREHFADCARAVVCANLPYQITTPVLTALVKCGCFERLTVMIQREVARRICARENTADYGAFSVLMQWHCETELLFDVPPHCFIPAPKVTSSVIRLTRRAAPPAKTADEARMFALVRAAFQQRRKTLCNAMMHGLNLSRAQAAAALASCGLPEQIRGEALSVAQFAALSDALGRGCAWPESPRK